MKHLFSHIIIGYLLIGFMLLLSCNNKKKEDIPESKNTFGKIVCNIEAEQYSHAGKNVEVVAVDSVEAYVQSFTEGWIAFDADIPIAGRYKIQVKGSPISGQDVSCWVEDYYDNRDDRIYNISGSIVFSDSSNGFSEVGKDGSPLNCGLHRMKLHFDHGLRIDRISFSLLKVYRKTPVSFTQNTKGEKWEMVWSDEFDGAEIDTSKWDFEVGNWGWGNHEIQYYTDGKKKNARVENGNLVIEAFKNDTQGEWTSARLTTHGRISFLYGKIEIRAKVPAEDGNWAAGYTMGDEYIDEASKLHCGEIDILESVGYEMNDESGDGIAHASAFSGDYYFKSYNQPRGSIKVKNMNGAFHTYAAEWTPEGIKEYVDGHLYISYNEKSTDLSWPFSMPQNIILQLAIGGSWAGSQGIYKNVGSIKMIVDYVRVYERR